jgi:hypothetical protein
VGDTCTALEVVEVSTGDERRFADVLGLMVAVMWLARRREHRLAAGDAPDASGPGPDPSPLTN